MEIGPISNRPAVHTVPPGILTGQPLTAAPDQGVSTEKDSIEISQDARRKLAEMADEALRTDRRDRVEQIRGRIAEGFYDRPEVKEQVAERLMNDLD